MVLRRRARALRPSAVVLVGSLLLAGCGDGGGTTDAADGAPTLIATTAIVADLVDDLLVGPDGPVATVEVLMPPGADPHEYAPSARDGVALREAAVVVAVGLGFEEGLRDSIETARADGVPVLELHTPVEVLPLTGGDPHADEEEHAEEEEAEHADEEDVALDPHVWLDPARVADVVAHLAVELAALLPDAAATIAANGETAVAAWRALDAELEEVLAVVPAERRVLVTTHDAYGYFADRYGFEVAAVLQDPGAAGARPQAFLEAVEVIRERDLPAVFLDAGSGDQLADALREEVPGLEVVELFTETLGEADSGEGTLAGILRTDAARIAAALG